ncbi:MAG: hypothetical protein OCC49_00615 [Fibrobacterales bacterium]
MIHMYSPIALLIFATAFLTLVGCVEDGVTTPTADAIGYEHYDNEIDADSNVTVVSLKDNSLNGIELDTNFTLGSLEYSLAYGNNDIIIDSLIVGFVVYPQAEPFIALEESIQTDSMYSIRFTVPKNIPLIIGYTALYEGVAVASDVDTLTISTDSVVVKSIRLQ